MKSSTKYQTKSLRDVAYYRQRYQNRVFSALVKFVSEQSDAEHITKKNLADRLNKDAGQVSRLLGHPSNLTLDTISDLLLAFDAEAEPPDIELFRDKRAPNIMHHLMFRAQTLEMKTRKFNVESSGSTEFNLNNNNRITVNITTASS